MRQYVSRHKGALSLLIVCIFILAAVISSCGGGGGGTANNNDNNTGATLSGTVQPDPNDSTAAGQNSGATVYIVGQQNSAVQTDSNGNFNLPVDATLSGTVLSSPSVNREAAPATNTYGLVVISASNTHGRKTEATVTEGRENNLDTVYINTVGAISGKAFLQNAPGNDHTGIRVYIPGTSFLATTNANGNYTISNVPSGTYDLVRADLSGSVYHYAMVARVTVNSGQTTTLPDMLLQTSVGENGKIIINNEAAYTTSKTVELQIAPSANAVLMQISDDINFTGLTWEDVKPTKTFTFSGDFSAGGTATVYAKFADVSGLTSSPVSAQIYIDTNPLATIVSPVNAGNTASTKPMLDWKYDPPMPSPKYHVEIDDIENSCSMTTPLEQATDLTASQYTLSAALNNGSTYYWCVAIIDESGHQWNWAGPWSFTVDLGTVNLLSPTNTSVISDTTPTFTWSANSNAVSYSLFIQGEVSSATYTTSQTSYVPTLVSEGTYTWSVTPVDQFGQSGTTASPYSFILDTTPPAGESIIISGTTGTGIVINNNDILAASPLLTLTLKASDSNGVNAYYVSTSSTLPNNPSWVAVTPTSNFSATPDFDISGSDSGTIFIYVWFRDRAGNISNILSPYSDSIEYIKFALYTPDQGGSGKRVGHYSSITTSPTGTVHISYLNFATGEILYTSSTPTGWTIPTVIDSVDPESPSNTSIGVDSSNNLHISYYDQTNSYLKYTFYEPLLSSRTTTTISSNVDPRSALAVDSSGNVHISYYVYATLDDLKYALKSSGTWTTKTVDGGPTVAGLGNSIATHPTGTSVHISYYDTTNASIKHAYSLDSGTIWSTETITSASPTFASLTSIAVDSNDKAHVCFVDATTHKLYYATNAVSSWDTLWIADNQLDCSITVDSGNYVHISYGNSSGVIKYATNKYGSWASAVVDNSGNVFQPDIAVDSNGKVHISYLYQWYAGGYNGSLKYARSQ